MLQASSGVNFLVCLLMMLLDSLLYCLIGLYLDKVSSFLPLFYLKTMPAEGFCYSCANIIIIIPVFLINQ